MKFVFGELPTLFILLRVILSRRLFHIIPIFTHVLPRVDHVDSVYCLCVCLYWRLGMIFRQKTKEMLTLIDQLD